MRNIKWSFCIILAKKLDNILTSENAITHNQKKLMR